MSLSYIFVFNETKKLELYVCVRICLYQLKYEIKKKNKLEIHPTTLPEDFVYYIKMPNYYHNNLNHAISSMRPNTMHNMSQKSKI